MYKRVSKKYPERSEMHIPMDTPNLGKKTKPETTHGSRIGPCIIRKFYIINLFHLCN